MRRLFVLAATTIATLSVTAPMALAFDGGEGWAGENNDLMVTMFGFAVLIGIPAFALLASLLQWRLDQRKYRKLAAAKARDAQRDRRLGW